MARLAFSDKIESGTGWRGGGPPGFVPEKAQRSEERIRAPPVAAMVDS
jgi:hypothetical protein